FQIALAAAWFFGAAGWLVERGWDWREPYCLHIYGLGIGGLCLAWELARLALARTDHLSPIRQRGAALLSPTFPIDRPLTGALIVGQYALLLCVVSWSLGRELNDTPDVWRVLPAAWHDNAYALGAWLLPLLLACVLIVWLRELDMALPLMGLTVLLLSLPL